MKTMRYESLDRAPRGRRRGEHGQVIVVMAMMIVVMLIVAGLAMDGGYAWVQQRQTQGAADAIAESGTVIIAERLAGGARTPANIVAAMNTASAANLTGCPSCVGPGSYTAYYTRGNDGIAGMGCLLAASGSGCWTQPTPGDFSGAYPISSSGTTIPVQARGVRVVTTRTFGTTFIRASAVLPGAPRLDEITAHGDATAVTGPSAGVCSAADGCGVWPLTFPVQISTCDGQNRLVPGSEIWPIVDLNSLTNNKMAIVPLCSTNGAGSFGFLDMGTGGTLASQITTPTNSAFNVPTWLQTKTGNVNSVEAELNTYIGKIVLIPLFDGTCREVPPSGNLADCTNPGTGNNAWYHIPYFAAFYVYRAYVQGANNPPCNSLPGQPFIGSNGAGGCIKGWFVRYITQGPVGIGDFDPSSPAALSVQLVR